MGCLSLQVNSENFDMISDDRAINLIKSLYVIGSLRNEEIPKVASSLRTLGLDVFDDWYAAGEFADDSLRDYYRERGLSYSEILQSYAAQHIFHFDRSHLDRCDGAILVMPGGKSAHLELGYVIGQGKPGFILMDQEPERVDIMHQFATKIFMNKEEMLEYFDKQLTDQDYRAKPVGRDCGFGEFS